MHFPELVPLTQAPEHSDTLLHILLVCIFFLNTRFPKYFSCHVIFSFILFNPVLKLIDLLCLLLGILLRNILRQKKMNLPGVSVALIELWVSALEKKKKKERKLLKLNVEYQISTLTIVSGGKCIEILVHFWFTFLKSPNHEASWIKETSEQGSVNSFLKGQIAFKLCGP